jgi:hypothetical protein
MEKKKKFSLYSTIVRFLFCWLSFKTPKKTIKTQLAQICTPVQRLFFSFSSASVEFVVVAFGYFHVNNKGDTEKKWRRLTSQLIRKIKKTTWQ